MRKAILLALLLSGCATPEEIAHRRALQAQEQARQQEAYREHVLGQCDGMGFSRGTEAHANCALQIHNQIQANRAAIGAAYLQGQIANQPRQTQCARDFIGRVNCVSR